MEMLIALARAGSAERWDAIPEVRFDKAKKGNPLNASGKLQKKRRKKRVRGGLIDTPLKGAEKRQMDIQDTVRFP